MQGRRLTFISNAGSLRSPRMVDDAPSQLEYAQAPAWHRRPRFRRAAFAAGLVVVLVLSWKWIGAGVQHARLLYWQGQCLAYAAPAERVVVDGTNRDSAARCWGEFYTLFSPPGRQNLTTVFLHELRKSDGARRLVALEASAFFGNGSHPDSEVSLDYHVIAPATLWSRAKLVTNAAARPYFYYEGGEGHHFQILAGQVDPKDPSHFTIPLRWKDRTVTLDGWLRDDDTILLEPRDRLERLQVSKY